MTTKTMTMTGPVIKTALPGPNAKRVLEGDDRYISPSYTRSYPLVAKEGRGIVVTDVDGNEFFDFSSGIAVTSTGHCHPDALPLAAAECVRKAITKAWSRWRNGSRKSRQCQGRTAFTTATRARRQLNAR